MLGGPYSQNKFDANKIFQDNNADILQMNSMIREHMMNIQQHAAASAFNGVTVGNFDQSPINENYLPHDDKDGRKAVFATNQKTPMPSKNTNKEMKENYHASGAPSSAALISGIGMSGSS